MATGYYHVDRVLCSNGVIDAEADYEIPAQPCWQCLVDLRADVADADLRHGDGDRLRPVGAGSHKIERGRRFSRACWPDPRHAAADPDRGESGGRGYVQWPDKRRTRLGARVGVHRRHGGRLTDKCPGPQRHRELLGLGGNDIRRRSRHLVNSNRRNGRGERADAAKHRLLSAARQFAVDVPAGYSSWNHQDAKPDDGSRERRLRLRLPSGVHRQWRHDWKPLRQRLGSVEPGLLRQVPRRADRQLYLGAE